MTATLSILGLYDYDPTIFDLMTLPAGIDKNLVRDNILLQAADFEVLYPDPIFMKQAIKRWADKWYFTFERWHKALLIEYDPLNNYDRYEEYEDVENASRTDTGRFDTSRESSTESSGENIESGSNSSSSTSSGNTSTSGTTQHDISAYDSATMRENTKDTSSSSGTDSSTTSTSMTETKNGSDSESSSSSESGTDTTSNTGKTDRTLKHKAHLYGNIGVTTSQQMLESELNVVRFNLVEQITDCFVTEFCLMVY